MRLEGWAAAPIVCPPFEMRPCGPLLRVRWLVLVDQPHAVTAASQLGEVHLLVAGQHPLIGSEKKSIMFVAGVEGAVRNLKVTRQLHAVYPRGPRPAGPAGAFLELVQQIAPAQAREAEAVAAPGYEI